MLDPIPLTAESETSKVLTARQWRLLRWMREGDQLFEVVGRTWRTVWDERCGRDHRVHASEVDELIRLGFVQKVANSFPQRLDVWALTPSGKKAAEDTLSKRHRAAHHKP